ncbi:MAG: hypothetical protein KDA88_01235 [Planctomycetaceae bacterium]|nr:hypothetical protein [Planctomycetaceae bacterium]MCB9950750.1 hypothetical protein [Planctomycetaceae bacterium]
MKTFRNQTPLVGWTKNHVLGLSLMVFGVAVVATMLAMGIRDLVDGQGGLLESTVGLIALAISAAVTLAGFCLFANWTDSEDLDENNPAVVRQFSESDPVSDSLDGTAL